MDAVQAIDARLADLRHRRAVIEAVIEELEAVRDTLAVPRAVADRMAAPPPAGGTPHANGKAHEEGGRPGKPQPAGPAGALAGRVARLLAESGPLQVVDIGRRLGADRLTVGRTLRGDPATFEKVDPSQLRSPYRLTAAGTAALNSARSSSSGPG